LSASETAGAYLNYAPGTHDEHTLKSNYELCHNPHVPASRSKPAALAPVLTRTGRQAFRVTVSIGRKQRKRQFNDLADAEACQSSWELERVGQLAAMRPKVTRLTHEQLAHAETAVQMLDSTGYSLIDAVRHLLRFAPPSATKKIFGDARNEFLTARKGKIGEKQYKNYEGILRRLESYLGRGKLVTEITTGELGDFIKSLGKLSPKSQNTYRDDMSAFFSWCAGAPNRWIGDNPVDGIERYRLRDVLPEDGIAILEANRAGEAMAWLEINHADMVPFFVLTLFAGIRPELEMTRLARDIGVKGLGEYLRNGSLHLTKRQTKDGRSRQVPLSSNAMAWLAAYPLTAESCRPPARDAYAAVRSELKLGHNVLRHTSISACTALHGITEAALRHGNSERQIRDHYLSRMTAEDAKKFYAIVPRRALLPVQANAAA
jgi:hypothetical protein